MLKLGWKFDSLCVRGISGIESQTLFLLNPCPIKDVDTEWEHDFAMYFVYHHDTAEWPAHRALIGHALGQLPRLHYETR